MSTSAGSLRLGKTKQSSASLGGIWPPVFQARRNWPERELVSPRQPCFFLDTIDTNDLLNSRYILQHSVQADQIFPGSSQHISQSESDCWVSTSWEYMYAGAIGYFSVARVVLLSKKVRHPDRNFRSLVADILALRCFLCPNFGRPHGGCTWFGSIWCVQLLLVLHWWQECNYLLIRSQRRSAYDGSELCQSHWTRKKHYYSLLYWSLAYHKGKMEFLEKVDKFS